MIIILASVDIQPGQLERALEESQAHVMRSRLEPGCISHAVHRSYDNPNRIMFVERWADRAAMQTHFGVPEARAFAKVLAELAAHPAEMQIYEAEQVT